MITRDDLERLRELQHKKESLEERRKRLRESVQRFSSPLSGMPRAPSWHDKMAEYAAKLDALDNEIADLIIEIEQTILRIEREIDALPANQAEVIRLRYVQGYGWKKIAKTKHYSVGHCKNIHTAAIKKLES